MIISLLKLHADWGWDERGAISKLSIAKRDRLVSDLDPLATQAAANLEPIEHKALVDRLTLLGMSMMHGKDAAQVQAWLHETARLLSDLPQIVLFDAIDDCVREPGRVFPPTVGEIREKAEPAQHLLMREAANLRRLAILAANLDEIPDWEPPKARAFEPQPEFKEEDRCTPEEVKAILQQFGFRSHYADNVVKRVGVPLSAFMNEADYIAAGEVPPSARPKADPYEMMP